ncbi:MAG: alpha/beta hydrolase [Propionibacteriaceae bacterium]|jgi:pimeloyl-ACP methyl ester carboxylesterase|nr:alpha/beta hydrolase [Propionibacteriaceae bacterium]
MDVPLLIFLHGPGQSPPAWQDVVTHINPDQPMVAPWLTGLKPGEESGFDMDKAVESLLDLMEARGAERADLVGYSLGGLVAARMAARYPTKVAHVVLISTPILPSQAVIKRQRALAKVTPAALFHGVGKQYVLDALDALIQANLSVDVSKVEAPMLAIAAADDLHGKASAQELADQVGALVRLAPGSDPNVVKTAPALVAQLVSDFCSDFLDDSTDRSPA